MGCHPGWIFVIAAGIVAGLSFGGVIPEFFAYICTPIFVLMLLYVGYEQVSGKQMPWKTTKKLMGGAEDAYEAGAEGWCNLRFDQARGGLKCLHKSPSNLSE
jgi:hypothetical protein